MFKRFGIRFKRKGGGVEVSYRGETRWFEDREDAEAWAEDLVRALNG